jgi:hypothetical protein
MKKGDEMPEEERIYYKCDRCDEYETYWVCESCHTKAVKHWEWQIGDFKWKINALWIALGISLLVNFFLWALI